MTGASLRLAPGEAVTPERAGWAYLSFSVETFTASTVVGRAGHETAIVVLGGGGVRVGDLEPICREVRRDDVVDLARGVARTTDLDRDVLRTDAHR